MFYNTVPIAFRIGSATRRLVNFLAAESSATASDICRSALDAEVARRFQKIADATPITASSTARAARATTSKEFPGILLGQFEEFRHQVVVVMQNEFDINDVQEAGSDAAAQLALDDPLVLGQVIALLSLGKQKETTELIAAKLRTLREMLPGLFVKVPPGDLKGLWYALLTNGRPNATHAAAVDRADCATARRDVAALLTPLIKAGKPIPVLSEESLRNFGPPYDGEDPGVGASRHPAASGRGGKPTSRRKSQIATLEDEQGTTVAGGRSLISPLPQE
jgi:hypothetical protein